MKNFLILLALLSCSFVHGQSEPLTTTRGQGISGVPSKKEVSPNLQAPYFQMDKLSSGNALINTGNKNMLPNSGCEAQTATGWTSPLASVTDTGSVAFGAKKCSFAGAGTGSTYNGVDYSSMGGAIQGTQGYAEIYARSSDSSQYLGMWVDGVLTATKPVTPDNKWKLYDFPFIFGSSTASIGMVKPNAGVSGFGLDEAYIGVAGNLKQAVDGSRLIGQINWDYALNCRWSGSSTTWASFAVDADCPNPTVTGNILAPSTKIPAFKIQNSGYGTYTVVVNGAIDKGGATAESGVRLFDGTIASTMGSTGRIDGTYVGTNVFVFNDYTPNSANEINLQYFTASGNVGVNLNLSTNYKLTISVFYTPPQSAIYSTQCNSDIECADRFSADVSATGVVTNDTFDWINGNCTNASPSVCTLASGLATQPLHCFISNNEGIARWGSFSTTGSTSISFKMWNDSGVDETTSRSKQIVCFKTGVDYKARRNIVGSFQNVVTVPNVSAPKSFRLQFGSGADCGVLCSSGTCTICRNFGGSGAGVTSVTYQSAGVYRINGINGLKYQCTGGGIQAGSVYAVSDRADAFQSTTYKELLFSGSSNVSQATIDCVGE